MLKILKNPLFFIVFLGALIRLYGVLNFPLRHDEIISILEGVKKTRSSWEGFFFRSSLENCLGVTPLYFWVEGFFTKIFGENNLGLRFFPLLSGTFTPLLAYFVVKKQFSKRIAFLSAFLVAFSSNFIWSSSKAQYFEVLMLPVFFLIFYFAFSEKKIKFYFLSFLFLITLFTYFGKALAVFLVFLFWYGMTKIFEVILLKKGKKEVLKEGVKEVFQLSVFFSLLLFWFLLSQVLVFKKGVIESAVGLGKVKSIWEMIFLTTFGYGIASKQFLAGSRRGSFLIFDDIKIWPTEGLVFVPFLVGFILVIKNFLSSFREEKMEKIKLNSYFLFTTILPIIYIFLLGLICARFHFLYFVPFVIISALGLEKIFFLLKENKKFHFLILLFWITHIAYISSWESWYYKVFNFEKFVILFILLSLLIIFEFFASQKISFKTLEKVYFAIVLGGIILANFFAGPFIWGRKAEWEPAFDNKLKPCPECYAEKSEKELINFAIIKKDLNICKKLPENYQKVCLEKFK